jgi:EmrB/QacA subfamily drug resistance transporter
MEFTISQDNENNKNKWFVMAAVAMGVFLATIDSSIVNIALPVLVKELNTTFTIIEWVVLIYLLTISILMLSVGRISDMVGKKPIYLAGFIVFTLGSFLCGLSNNVYALIGFRSFQAIGAAFLMVLGTAIITEAFPSSERGMALGINGTIVSLGIITGPTIGGLILNYLKWNWIFFVNIPVSIVGIILVSKFVKNKKPEGKQKFDIPGAIALFFTLGCLLFGLTMGQLKSFTQPESFLFLLLFPVFGGIFILIEKKVSQPMLDLSLFDHFQFSSHVIEGLVVFFANSGIVFLLPFYLQNVLQHSSSTSGLMMGVIPAVMAITAPVAGKLSDKNGTEKLPVVGLCIFFLGILALSTVDESTSIGGYILRTIPIGLGLGIFQSPNNSAIMGLAPKNRLGVASGILALTRTLGQTSGIALTSALWVGRIVENLGWMPKNGATGAPSSVQVSSLHYVLHFSAAIIFFGIVLSVISWIAHKRTIKGNIENSQEAKVM